MKDFLSLGADFQSMYFIPTRFLKDNINGVSVPLFQPTYIRDTTHPSHMNMVNFCCEVHYMWCGDQDLELH